MKETPNQKVRIEKIHNPATGEVELYCHSEARDHKEQALQDRFAVRYEQQLQNLAQGLHKKDCTKNYDKILLRIGLLNEKYARAAQHYTLNISKDSEGKTPSTSLRNATTKPDHKPPILVSIVCAQISPTGVKSDLWHTYTMLTDLEAYSAVSSLNWGYASSITRRQIASVGNSLSVCSPII